MTDSHFIHLLDMPLLNAAGSHGLIIGEAFVENVDVIGNFRVAFTEFIESGRAATCAVGFALGYLIKSITI